MRKLLADFTVSSDAARVAVVTFSSKNRVVRHIDHLTTKKASATMSEPHKCFLLEQELPAIGYTGGGTYTVMSIERRYSNVPIMPLLCCVLQLLEIIDYRVLLIFKDGRRSSM